MSKVIDVSGFAKREPMEIIIGDTTYTVPVPTLGKMKLAAKIRQEAGEGEFDQLDAAIKSLAAMTGISADVFDGLTLEEMEALSNAMVEAKQDDDAKNVE